MVVTGCVREYVTRMLNEVPGMKALLLDKDTVGIVSLVLSQSDILHKEVFLVERIDGPVAGAPSGARLSSVPEEVEEPMTHLKAICFVRPVADNIAHLERLLKKPRFGEYHLFFSNTLSSPALHTLAQADEKLLVKQVQEFYADYFAVDPYHFTLNFGPENYKSYLSPSPSADSSHPVTRVGERCVDALAALFLSLKKRPVIRYQKSSSAARRCAQEAGRVMYEKEKPLFDFRRTELAPLLLILDRRDDPVTPLLNQWTYQAMVHELIGIKDNRVDLRAAHGRGTATDYRGSEEDQKKEQLVLSSEQDPIFKSNMYENFGDVGTNIARLVEELQQNDKTTKRRLQTLEAMAEVLESYPEYRKQAGSVSKHVSVMSELQRCIDSRQLMSVAQTEQDLAGPVGSTSQAQAFEAVMSQLSNEKVADVDRLRLVMLYALRFEKEAPRQLEQLMAKLASRPSKEKPALVYALLRHCGSDMRTGDLYGNKDLFNIVKRGVQRGLKGVENIYTQHEPLLLATVEAALKGRLRDVDYPFIGDHFQQGRPQELILFVLGGTTYEEARMVAQQNAANAGVRIVLGGTTILNSANFLSDLTELHSLDERAGLQVDGQRGGAAAG
eukprot:TRINITY_DN2207_c0_g2_i1.p1 TRINITY_DN2207_c0_g2~~TRINITY_DN2207_c0_g2_i1.p1  ORF type:complete len:613 (+),score=136.96 TRINITY_DN2207_c0_g2_i1:493-2331(+)